MMSFLQVLVTMDQLIPPSSHLSFSTFQKAVEFINRNACCFPLCESFLR